jgi:hypothetical protein
MVGFQDSAEELEGPVNEAAALHPHSPIRYYQPELISDIWI